MTHEQGQDQRMLEWLEAGPWDVPAEPLEAAVAYARTHPRRRLPGAGLRRMVMSQIHLQEVQPPVPHRRWGLALSVAAVAVVAVAVVAGGVGLLNRNNQDQGGGIVVPPASPTAAPTVAPTPQATPAPTNAPATQVPLVGDRACIVATVAGKAATAGAVDGPAEAARFSTELGSPVFDKAGALYVADAGNNAIRKLTKDGQVTTVVGKLGEAGSTDGASAAARLGRPVGIGFDAEGNLYVADSANHTIRKITPDGTVSTLAGKAGEAGQVDGKGADARFSEPWSLAVSPDGTVYVGESSAIRMIAPDGTVTTLAGRFTSSGYAVDGVGPEAGFGWPFGLAMGPDGVLYVVDANASTMASVLRTVAPDGTVATIDADWTGSLPGTIWVDPSGVVYNASYPSGTVSKLTPDGTVTLLAGIAGLEGSADGTGDVAEFSGLMGIVMDASGTLYVGDSYNSTIRTITCP